MKRGLGIVKVIFGVIILLILAGGSFYSIQEEEQAVVCTFVSPNAVTTPGMHFKIPFVQTVTKSEYNYSGIYDRISG